MDFLIANRDFAIAIAALALSIFNTIKSFNESRILLGVSLDASMDNGEPEIQVINHSRFDVSVSIVGLVSDIGELEPIWYFDYLNESHDLPRRIASMAAVTFNVGVGFRILDKQTLFRPFVVSSTGKVFYGADRRGLLRSVYYRVKAIVKNKFAQNRFNDL